MTALIYGTLLILTAFLLQIIIWRIHLPKRQTVVLLFIFFTIIAVGPSILSHFAPGFNILGVGPPSTFYEFLQTWLFTVAVTLAYMITYSAIEADSPSLIMILMVHNAGVNGLPKDEMEKKLTNDLLILPRLKDLITDNMAVLNQERYVLTPKGIFLANLFNFYRNVLGLGKGG